MTTWSSAPSPSPAAGGERAVPYYCPFCAEEDLRPHARAPFRHSAPGMSDENGGTERTGHGAWHCRTCLRVFAVRFLGLEGLSSVDPRGTTGGAP